MTVQQRRWSTAADALTHAQLHAQRAAFGGGGQQTLRAAFGGDREQGVDGGLHLAVRRLLRPRHARAYAHRRSVLPAQFTGAAHQPERTVDLMLVEQRRFHWFAPYCGIVGLIVISL